MYANWGKRRSDDCYIWSEITASASIVDSETEIDNLPDLQIACIPPLNTPLIIDLNLIFDDVQITISETPFIHATLLEMLNESNIWQNLHYKSTIQSTTNGFQILLNDNLYSTSTFNDLLLAPSELKSLNKLQIQTLETILISVKITHLIENGFTDSWKSCSLIQDLNMAMFENFFLLEAKFPLIFNYISRSTYLASKDLIPYIVSTCTKSNHTQLIDQRSVISGILKNLSHCNSWIYHVKTMHSSTIDRKYSNNNYFTIQWFSQATL